MNQRKRLLIIDDDEILLQTFGRMLAETAYDFDTAATIESANTLIDVYDYDAILLDYLMEADSGMKFVKKGEWNRNGIKMILIVGHVTHAKVRDFFLEGVSGYLLKPFNKEDLMGTLNAHLFATPIERPLMDNSEEDSTVHDSEDKGGL